MPIVRSRGATWFTVAVQALARLAHSDAPCSSSEMAPDLQSHAVFLRRVLAQLGRAGLIRAREGRAGGYLLARSPEEITLAEVYQAVRTLDVSDGVEGACDASTPVLTALDEIEAEAERAWLESLARVSLADLLHRAAAGATTPGVYAR
ncbi:MAG TPA: Rrf2 family transcriptional regulator [Ktedonobacterales bacterium]